MSEKMIVACPECRTRFVAPLEKFLPSGRKVRCAKCGHSWFQNPEPESATEQPATAPPPLPATPDSDVAQVEKRAASGISVIERAEQRRAELAASAPSEDQAVGTTSVQEMTSALEPTREEDAPRVAPTREEPEYTAAAMPQNAPVTIPERRSFWPRALFYSLAAAIVAGCAGYFFKDALSTKFPSLAPHLSSWHDKVDSVVGNVIPTNRPLRIDNVAFNYEEIEGGRALLVNAEVVNESDSETEAPMLTVSVLGPEDAVLRTVDIATEDMSEKIGARMRAPYFLRMPLPPEDTQRVQVEFSDK